MTTLSQRKPQRAETLLSWRGLTNPLAEHQTENKNSATCKTKEVQFGKGAQYEEHS